MPQGETRKATKAHDEKRSKKPSAAWEALVGSSTSNEPSLANALKRSCGLCSVVILVDPGPLSRVTFLGANLSDFMTQLGMTPTGGRTGTITRLRRQSNRLFDAAISVQYHGEGTVDAGLNLTVASGKSLWWTGTDRSADQRSLLPSTVWLLAEFYRHVVERPVPLSLDALRALQGSSLRLDICAWLTIG